MVLVGIEKNYGWYKAAKNYISSRLLLTRAELL